jgi:hypothetical protein
MASMFELPIAGNKALSIEIAHWLASLLAGIPMLLEPPRAPPGACMRRPAMRLCGNGDRGGAMMSRSVRYACRAALLLAVLIATTPAQAWCIWGFGQCAPSLVGEYALEGSPIARLIITADKITSAIGPVSFSADYVIKSFDGNNVTIEVRLPDSKVPLNIQVEKDQIRIGTKHVLAGVWKRQAGK